MSQPSLHYMIPTSKMKFKLILPFYLIITNIKTIILIGYTPTARLKNKHGLKANQPNFLATKQNYTVSTDHLAVLSCAVQQLGTKTVCIF